MSLISLTRNLNTHNHKQTWKFIFLNFWLHWHPELSIGYETCSRSNFWPLCVMVHTFSIQKPKIASCLHSKPVQSHRKTGIILFWVVEIFDSCHVSSVHTGNRRNLDIVVKSPERLWWWYFQSWSQNQFKSQAKLNPMRIWIWLLLRKALQYTFF